MILDWGVENDLDRLIDCSSNDMFGCNYMCLCT